MNPEHRINELKKRQVYYGSSMVVKLESVSGVLHYKVSAWLGQKNVDTKSLILEGRYNGEDPVDLIQAAMFQLGLKKLKCGRPIC